MFNLDKETLIAGVILAAATAGIIAGDIAMGNYLLKRRVAALMVELKLTIKEFHEEASSQDDWADMDEAARILKIERLIAHEILSITNLLDPKTVVHLRQAATVEIKKIIAG